ncbi:hypothetical protein ACHAWC_000561 [Mediolabrus comicus]
MNSCVGEEEDDYFCENADEEPQSPPSAAAAAAEEDDEPIPYRNHLIDVTNITYPIILAEIFQNTLPLIDLAFVDQQTRTNNLTYMHDCPFFAGQLGKDELASAALATAWFNLWNSTMIGFMTAIDTILSQSYGANQ